jgi:hypothetical protein
MDINLFLIHFSRKRWKSKAPSSAPVILRARRMTDGEPGQKLRNQLQLWEKPGIIKN